MSTYINTYDIVTQGVNQSSSYKWMSQGMYVYLIEIETLTPTPTPFPTPTPTPNNNYNGAPSPLGLSKTKRKKGTPYSGNTSTEQTKPIVEVKKRVTVYTVIDGVEYKKSKLVKNKPNLTVDDVDVVITNNVDKPKITIKIKK